MFKSRRLISAQIQFVCYACVGKAVELDAMTFAWIMALIAWLSAHMRFRAERKRADKLQQKADQVKMSAAITMPAWANEAAVKRAISAALQEFYCSPAGVRNARALDLLSLGDLATDLAPLLLKQLQTEAMIATATPAWSEEERDKVIEQCALIVEKFDGGGELHTPEVGYAKDEISDLIRSLKSTKI